ncbi:hypothetical protein LRO89_02985 [Priestia megaterium]|uniref:hypothetical protein n=1 Tax=Priestia megaterium TaxID=1404 RepID=UPI0039C1DF3C
MGRHNKSASLITGHHFSETEKQTLMKLEQEMAGASDRLEKGLYGLYDHEFNQLSSQSAQMNYHVLAEEASTSSAIGNMHISTLIDLANEIELLKQYEIQIEKHDVVIFVGEKPVSNPAVKMRQDSLKSINAMKSFLGLGVVDIATLARKKLESKETNELTSLFTENLANQAFGEETTNEV